MRMLRIRSRMCIVFISGKRLTPLPTDPMTRKTSHAVTITLDAHEWGILSCLLSVHKGRPVMSPYDTAFLEEIRIKLNGALEADVHPYDASSLTA